MGVLEIESRYEGPEAGKNIANLKSEKRRFSMDWTAVCMKEGGEPYNEAVKVSRGLVMLGPTDHLRSLDFILRIVQHQILF